MLNTDRSALGRQPGVVHHRGRRDVRRLAARVRHGVLGVLRRADPDALRAVLPPGRLRLPQQGARPALAQRLGLGHLHRRHRAAARVRRRLRQPAAGRAVPLRPGPPRSLHRLVRRPPQSVRAARGRRERLAPGHARCDLPAAPHRRGSAAARGDGGPDRRLRVHRHVRRRRRMARHGHRGLRDHGDAAGELAVHAAREDGRPRTR